MIGRLVTDFNSSAFSSNIDTTFGSFTLAGDREPVADVGVAGALIDWEDRFEVECCRWMEDDAKKVIVPAGFESCLVRGSAEGIPSLEGFWRVGGERVLVGSSPPDLAFVSAPSGRAFSAVAFSGLVGCMSSPLKASWSS